MFLKLYLLQTFTSTNKNVCGLSLSLVWLFVTPWTVARQAPLSMEFSRKEYWTRLPFPTPTNKNKEVKNINLPTPRNFLLATFQSHLLGNCAFCHHWQIFPIFKFHINGTAQYISSMYYFTNIMFWTKTYSCCIYHVFNFLYILVTPFYRCMTICISSFLLLDICFHFP